MYYLIINILCMLLLASCNNGLDDKHTILANEIKNDDRMEHVRKMAYELIKTGFNAGTLYNEVWIRDYNTFINISCDVMDHDNIKKPLLTFLKFQGEDGNIIDGFIPKEKSGSVGYKYIFSDNAPDYAGHKNSVETDQESSLIQAFYKYIKKTGDKSILDENVAGKTVLERLELALNFLFTHRFSEQFGLIWGATTADWGDVQPEHEWGVVLDENSHLSIDIYDNAMLLIALNNFIEMVKTQQKKSRWTQVRDELKTNIRKHLWDAKRNKFIPHLYLNGSPFPEDFHEHNLYFHGGTAVAIEAGLLSKEEIAKVNTWMLNNQQAAHAQSIGLTIYPPYPKGFFKNPSMYPYGYQNGGDWTWFGGRMIQQLIRYGFVKEAYQEIKPMINRVLHNNGFFEWYTPDGKPNGAGDYKGSAGVLAEAIDMLQSWADETLHSSGSMKL